MRTLSPSSWRQMTAVRRLLSTATNDRDDGVNVDAADLCREVRSNGHIDVLKHSHVTDNDIDQAVMLGVLLCERRRKLPSIMAPPTVTPARYLRASWFVSLVAVGSAT